MSKRVLACVLCGSERGGWVHPRLSMVLTVMARDQRYTVEFKFICDAQPFHFARNKAVAAARDGSFDALIMLDNDACAAFNPLDLIPLDGDVVCTATAFKLGTGIQMVMANCSCCLIRSSVWKKLAVGPWFLWETGEDELCSPQGGQGEDIHFLRLCQSKGLAVRTAQQPAFASHFHTCDLTAVKEIVR